MTRDQILAEVSRAVHAAFPDRADVLLRELEKQMPSVLPAGVRIAVVHFSTNATPEHIESVGRLVQRWNLDMERPAIALPPGEWIEWIEAPNEQALHEQGRLRAELEAIRWEQMNGAPIAFLGCDSAMCLLPRGHAGAHSRPPH